MQIPRHRVGTMDATAPMGFLRLAPRRNQHKSMVKPGTCRECGTAFIGRRATRAFCCAACRRTFNHRRLLRGADFYDLFMAMRFEREIAADEGAWTLLCKMAAAFKSEDDHERDGRKSWDDVAVISARNPHLQSVVVEVNVGRARRSGLVREGARR
jgi:hypothetical protein